MFYEKLPLDIFVRSARSWTPCGGQEFNSSPNSEFLSELGAWIFQYRKENEQCIRVQKVNNPPLGDPCSP